MKIIKPAIAVLTVCLMNMTIIAGVSAQTNNYTVDANWAQLPEELPWGAATSWVAADGKGQILVMVRAAPYFRVFNRAGELIRTWGDDESMFTNAHSVTFDDQGNVWATDANAHIAYKYNPDGELLMSLGSKGVAGDNGSENLFNRANYVSVTSAGDIFVSDGYTNSRIVQFTSEGEFVRIIGGVEGAGDGQLSVPHGVAIDSRGRVLVNDSGNQRIAVFSRDGAFVEAWPYPSRGGIVVTEDDTVYVSDVNAGAVNVIREGELIDSVSVEARAHGLTVDTDGAIYVSDARGQMVLKITPVD